MEICRDVAVRGTGTLMSGQKTLSYFPRKTSQCDFLFVLWLLKVYAHPFKCFYAVENETTINLSCTFNITYIIYNQLENKSV